MTHTKELFCVKTEYTSNGERTFPSISFTDEALNNGYLDLDEVHIYQVKCDRTKDGANVVSDKYEAIIVTDFDARKYRCLFESEEDYQEYLVDELSMLTMDADYNRFTFNWMQLL